MLRRDKVFIQARWLGVMIMVSGRHQLAYHVSALLTSLWLVSAIRGEDFADVVERAERSVVRIAVEMADGEGIGSGFVVDDQGTIVTNCHVLAGAIKATAHFSDGRTARIIGTLLVDESRDIAIAKIDRTDAPPLPLASALPRKGESVAALGAPVGLAFSATKGIVSSHRSAEEMRRELGDDGILGTWIQVDVPLSPGNSGGPLINMRGEVVAMSTLASSGVAQNLNFGISVLDIAKAIKYAEGAKVVPLAAFVAKLSTGESARGGPGMGNGDHIVQRREIPQEALDNYISSVQEHYKEIMTQLRQRVAQMKVDLRDIQRGRVGLPTAARQRGIVVVKEPVRVGRGHNWYFASEEVKRALIEAFQERIEELDELKNKLKGPDDGESLVLLLMNYGENLNLRKKDSIGFMDEIVVINAFNEHDVLGVSDEELPLLIYMDSTTGLAPGEILSGPFLVAGTATVEGPQGIPVAMTVLQEVTEDELRAAVEKRLGSLTDFRVWTSASGNYKVEARYVAHDQTSVQLEKRDGTSITVSRDQLSLQDRQFLDQRVGNH